MVGKIQHFGPNNQPFRTQDALLAFCLWSADVPFWDDRQPCIHRYNADILKRFGYGGLPIEDAAIKARAARKRGHVEYLFKWPKELRALIRAFHDEEHQIANRQGKASARNIEIMELKNISGEERAIRSACLLMKKRPEFMRLWESVTPRLRIMNPGELEEIGSNITRYPGWKELPLNATDELKKKMGLL